MADKKPVMDVSKPGKSAPSATSRPIIVGHGTMIKDPMVKTEGSTAPSDIDETTSMAKNEADTSETPKPASTKAVAPSQTGKTVAPPKSTETEEPETTQETSSAEETSDSASEGSSEAIVDAIAEQAELDSKKKRNPEEDERQELVKKLVEEKTYFLPIKQAEAHGAGKLVGIVIAVVVCLLVGGYLAADAGLYGNNVKVPISILGNSKDTNSSDQPSGQAVTPAATAPATTAQQTTTTLTRSDLGLAFTYPNSWGVPTITDTRSQPNDERRSMVYVTFQKLSRLTVSAQVMTQTHRGPDDIYQPNVDCEDRFGIGPITDISSLKTLNPVGVTKTATTVTEVKQLYVSSDAILVERFGAGPLRTVGCYGPHLGGYVTFKQPSNYVGVSLMSFDGDSIKKGGNSAYTNIATYDSYVKDPNQIFTAQDRKDIQAFLLSFKSVTK